MPSFFEKLKKGMGIEEPTEEPIEETEEAAEEPVDGKDKCDDMILWEKPDIKWSDIIGNDDAKKAIEDSIIFPYKRSDLFPLGWPRGILLFGPPGCGKTYLAKAIATE